MTYKIDVDRPGERGSDEWWRFSIDLYHSVVNHATIEGVDLSAQ